MISVFGVTPAAQKAIAKNRRTNEAVEAVRRDIGALSLTDALRISDDSMMRRAIDHYIKIVEAEDGA